MNDHVERQTRIAIRVWLQNVLLENEWSAEEWARRAGTSATNITRPLSPSCKILPTVITVAKLARAAGSQPDLLARAEPTPVRMVGHELPQVHLRSNRRSQAGPDRKAETASATPLPSRPRS